jgi:hypothetical protein
MIRAVGPGSLLVVIPAFNEVGAVGDVVRAGLLRSNSIGARKVAAL